MGRVLAGDAEDAGKPSGANLFQPDDTDASDGVATVQLGAEGWRQKAAHNLGVHTEVDEQPATNQTVYCRKTHGRTIKGQRREPYADDVRLVYERIVWLPFAGPSGSVLGTEGSAGSSFL